ncbi:MAG: inorganic phosphate transporter [Eubacteriales bacterium]
MDYLFITTISMTFLYAFINGYHDGGNVIATIIASRSIKVKTAFILGCSFEFAGAILLGTAVAMTVGTGIISSDSILAYGPATGSVFIISAILSSIIWNIVTAILGIPSSSSHALMGGLVGAGISAFGFVSVNWINFILKVAVVMVTSPIIGLATGFIIMKIMINYLIFKNRSFESYIKKFQFISMSALAFAHGSSDSQKAMGLIALELLIYRRIPEFQVPIYVTISCGLMIALGMSVGGYRIMRTVGKKLFTIQPVHSLASQISASAVILFSTIVGFPVSTTQIITSSVMGVGSAENPKKVKWIIVNKVLLSWFITIPSSAMIAFAIFKIISIFLR